MSFFFPEAGGDIEPAYDDLCKPEGCYCEEDGGYVACEDCYLTPTCPARKEAIQ